MPTTLKSRSKKRYKLLGNPTWVFNFDYGWFRVGQWIIRWRYICIWFKYIGRKKDVITGQDSQIRRTYSKG